MLKYKGDDEYERNVTKEIFSEWWQMDGDRLFTEWAKDRDIDSRFLEIELADDDAEYNKGIEEGRRQILEENLTRAKIQNNNDCFIG